MNSAGSATITDARAASRTIVRNVKPLSVVLFGSVAREGFGNDLDLLIVTDDKSVTVKDRYLFLHHCLKRHVRKVAIDPLIIPRSTWDRYYGEGSPFLNLITREGKSLFMRNAVKEWLKQAQNEVDMAEYLLEGGFSKGACYHAQQAVEKAIKAKLLEKGWDLERIHNIERLIAIGRAYRIRLSLTDDDVCFMDAIYRGRYPAEAGLLPMGEPTSQDAQRAVAIAKKIMKTAPRK